MTLLEALVVLAMAALVGLIGYPSLDRAYHSLDARAGALTLANDLRRTRASALRSGMPAELVPARDGRGYLLADGTKRPLPGGMAIKGDGARFFPDGSSTGGVFVVEGNSRFFRIQVEPATGVVVPP